MKFCVLVSFISVITLVHGQNNVFKFDVRDTLKDNVKFGEADTTVDAEKPTHSKSATCGYKVGLFIYLLNSLFNCLCNN